MGEHEKKKPISITIVGWIYIIIGGLMFISGTIDLVSFSQYGSVKLANVTPAIKEIPVLLRAILDFYQQNYMPVTLLQVIVSGLMLVSGVYFLKLHSWARLTLEIISWAGLIYLLAVEVFYITSWGGFMSGPVADGISKATVSFMLLGVVLGTALWGAILFGLIRFLRGDTVKRTLEKAVHKEVHLSYN